MSSFTQPLTLSPKGALWVTDRPLVYVIGCLATGAAVTVPAGFLTDLATIPRFAWMFLPPADPRYAAAAVLHDYLCAAQGWRRRTVDAIFDEALDALGAPAWQRWIMYRAVRLYAVLKRLK